MHPKNVRQIVTADDVIVAVPGTAVQGSDLSTTRGLVISTPGSNVGKIYVGGSTVTNSGGSKRGVTLSPGATFPVVLPIENANLLWVNADNAGDRLAILTM